MKAKELASILLQDPESEVVVLGDHGGWKRYDRKPRPVEMFPVLAHGEFSLQKKDLSDVGTGCLIL